MLFSPFSLWYFRKCEKKIEKSAWILLLFLSQKYRVAKKFIPENKNLILLHFLNAGEGFRQFMLAAGQSLLGL